MEISREKSSHLFKATCIAPLNQSRPSPNRGEIISWFAVEETEVHRDDVIAQGSTSRTWQSWDSNPGSQAYTPTSDHLQHGTWEVWGLVKTCPVCPQRPSEHSWTTGARNRSRHHHTSSAPQCLESPMWDPLMPLSFSTHHDFLGPCSPLCPVNYSHGHRVMQEKVLLVKLLSKYDPSK